MPSSQVLGTYNSPGVYITENTWGVIPASLVGHSSVYMLMSLPNANVTTARNTPIFIESMAAYNAAFGFTTNSELLAQSFFDQRSGVGLNCVVVRTNQRQSITLAAAAAASTVYSVTLTNVSGGATTTFTHTSPATGFTSGGILSALAALLNTTTSGVRFAGNNLVFPSTVTLSVSATLTLGTLFVPPTTPDINDVRLCLATAFDADLQKGFIIAPEFFRAYTSPTDLTALQNALEDFASDPYFNWIAFCDVSLAAGTASVASEFVRLVTAERVAMRSARGHSSLYAPYVRYSNTNVTTVTDIPPSAIVAATAVRVQREFGLRQPPASVNFPLRGVLGVSVPITRQVQEVLNPIGVNCLRQFRSQGVCIYGARTLAAANAPLYRFYLVRLVLNILAATLEDAYEGLVLTSVDGLGTTFSNVVGTGKAVCEQLRRAGALYGQSPDQAYQVICNATNNPGVDLDAGKLSVEVIVVPTATIEVIGITLSRAAIGSPLVETVTGVQSAATTTSAPSVTPRS